MGLHPIVGWVDWPTGFVAFVGSLFGSTITARREAEAGRARPGVGSLKVTIAVSGGQRLDLGDALEEALELVGPVGSASRSKENSTSAEEKEAPSEI